MTAPKVAFFIIRAQLRVAASTTDGDEKRLTTFARRVGLHADDAAAVEFAVKDQLAKQFPQYLVSEIKAVGVTESTYDTARLMQMGRPSIEVAKDAIPDATKPDYRIVPSTLDPQNWFRVVDPDGEESALYSYAECEEIIRLAKEGALLGSFSGVFKPDGAA